jgi:murein endopeptidase
LTSPEAPRWVELPKSGVGFVSGDEDGYGWGSSVLASVIIDAGQRYHDQYLAANPGKSPLSLNDASTKRGGPAHDHETHQAGLDLDLRLPRRDGTQGTRVGRADYDREATYRMIAAFAADPRVERVLITDSVLLQQIAADNPPWKAKVQDGGPKHKNHVHVDIAPWQPPVLETMAT